jgi:hypothetical protein
MLLHILGYAIFDPELMRILATAFSVGGFLMIMVSDILYD